MTMPESVSETGFEPRIGRSVSLDHAAELLGVSRRTVYNRIRDGRLQTIRTLGGSQRVLLDSVQDDRSHAAAVGFARRDNSVKQHITPLRRHPEPNAFMVELQTLIQVLHQFICRVDVLATRITQFLAVQRRVDVNAVAIGKEVVIDAA